MSQFRIKRRPDGSWSVYGYKYNGRSLDKVAHDTGLGKEGLRKAAKNVARSLDPTKEELEEMSGRAGIGRIDS